MRHPIELELAHQRQTDLRAAARSVREARIFRAEPSVTRRGLRIAGFRIALAR